LRIEHITASVRRPTTIGKIEAFHKAYEVKSHLFKEHWSFIRIYNYTRPIEGLNYLTPSEIYLKDKVYPHLRQKGKIQTERINIQAKAKYILQQHVF